jgi:hypothetical protein
MEKGVFVVNGRQIRISYALFKHTLTRVYMAYDLDLANKNFYSIVL